jgi:hypothetical protein
MTKNEFIKLYCKESKITEKELLKNQVVLPCKCDQEGCNGWAVVCNEKILINAHLFLYT